MNEDYKDVIAYHIKLIWDNDEGSHLYIQELIRDADQWTELADALADFYEESIDFVLRETPSASIGHSLVAEICMYVVGKDIFDNIARSYWQDKEE